MIILDTDIVTLYSYGRSETLRVRIEAAATTQDLAVTIITRMEILRGRFDSIIKANNPESLLKAMQRFRESEQLLDDFRLLDVTDVAARHFAELTRPKAKSKKGSKMKRGDLLIACIALAHGAVLVTRNLDDYKSVTGLAVENWAD